MKFKNMLHEANKKYNIWIMVVPFTVVALLATLIMIFPDGSNRAFSATRDFLTGTMGFYYILLGVIFVILGIYLATSKVGKIKLGGPEDKKMDTLTWAIMVFVATMAADLLFFALHEWSFYYNSILIDGDANLTEVDMIRNASAFPLFHFGPIPWLFYLVPAVAYAYMFFVRKRRTNQKISEATRPILGKYTDRTPGKIVDLFAIIGLFLGTATTFAVATPLITAAVSALTGVPNTNLLTIIILIVVAVLYSLSSLWGMKSMTLFARLSVILFCVLGGIFFIGGNPAFILESGLSGIGHMASNFISWSTWTDPSRSTSFPQYFTMFYWAYWIAWAVATPLFIAKISKGRTIREMLVGGLIFSLAGTFATFIIFGGFGLYHEVTGNLDIAAAIYAGADAAEVIIMIIQQLPLYPVALALIIVTMILFYATTLDSITYVMAAYSYKDLDIDASASKKMKLYWAAAFIILPIALIFSESTMHTLTAVAIIGAFPTSIILLMVITSFFKDIKNHNTETTATQPIPAEEL